MVIILLVTLAILIIAKQIKRKGLKEMIEDLKIFIGCLILVGGWFVMFFAAHFQYMDRLAGR